MYADVTEKEREALLKELIGYEIRALNPPGRKLGEPLDETTAEYQAYLRYGWMWFLFDKAEKTD